MPWLVVLINILAVAVLFFSFIGGIKDGAVKNAFNVIALIIAIKLAGIYYYILAGILSFLPGENWENFLGFFITLAIISVILHFIFLVPRKLVQKAWGKGVFFRLIGGVLGIFNAAISLALFALVLFAYPIFDWLQMGVAGSVVMTRLVTGLGFVQSLLPEVFRSAATMVLLPLHQVIF